MKKNFSSSLARVLRLENLESRQMLSVAPGELAVAAAVDSALMAEAEGTDDPIDVGSVDPNGENEGDGNTEVEASTVLTVSEYDAATRLTTISWEADENAATYSVQISRNGGESWIDYAQDLTETSSSITNVIPGRSYAFRVFALDSEGVTTTAYDELAFAPFDMTVSDSAFMFGETISAELIGSSDAQVEVVWYYVVDGENVEIEEAQGRLEFKPTQPNDVVIVATGVNSSLGCNVEATVSYVTEHASTVVTTLNDTVNANDGFVSLREAVTLYAVDGDTITFDESLANGVITLSGLQIDVEKSVIIDASSVGSITIDANDVSRIFQSSADSVTFKSLTLTNGYSQSVGGALYASAGSSLDLYNVRIVNSKADYHGGALYAGEGLQVSMVNVDITGNTATTYGSAICAYGANLDIVSGTIAGNTSEDSQGALFFNNDANANVYNSIVAANEGGDVVVGRSSNTTVNGYVVLTSYSDWSNDDGTILAYDPEADLFADAENGDYTLSPYSQAMDVGENDYVTTDYDLAGNVRIQSGIVDLGAYEFAGSQISFDYNFSTRQATLTWIPLRDAASYTVLLSRNGTEQVEYAKNLTEPTTTVNGLFVGGSYTFDVVGVAEDGTQLSIYRETTFAPIALSVDKAAFELGDTISATLKGAENAQAAVQWYYVTDEGDVEIEGANSLEYAPTSNLFDLRVVATGVGDSLGSNASLTISNLASKIDVVYDSATRVANIAWEAFDGISSYKVRLSRDGGETWIDYAKGLEDLSATVNGLWAGRTYGFRVYGETETGTTLAYRQATFTPINLKSETEVFTVDETISVELKGAASATADINWYFVTENGDVEIEEAAGQYEYTPTSDQYDVKVVATGTGESEGASVTLVFSSPAEGVSFEHNAQTHQAELTWIPIDGANGYRVRISRDGGETWNTYLRDVDGNTATVNGLYAGKSYSFRVYAVDENGASTDQYREATFAPVDVACYNAFKAGETVSITLKGAENATADISWFYVTGDGDVEIPEAQGLLEYAPVIDLFNLRVVAIGTGLSAGSAGETIVYSAGDPTLLAYNDDVHVATLFWRPIDNAVKYKVQISRDGGETWYQYAKDIVGTSQQINGVYVSRSYEFRVIGFAEDGAKLETTYEVSYSPESTADDSSEAPSSESLLDEAFADYFAEDF